MAYVCIIYMELMFQWGGGDKKGNENASLLL